MKYYIDTEFLEGTQSKKLLGITYGQTKPTIDLISIGIVAEDGREYYAISKDFNLKEAWNRFEIKKTSPAKKYIGIFEEKVYWIRENVLKPIMVELQVQYNKDTGKSKTGWKFKDFKYLINKYGKTNKQIALEIKEFIGTKETIGNWEQVKDKMNTQFYAYYGAFDYVAFSQIFGGFEGYPESFPQYFIDLKQELDIVKLKKSVMAKSKNNAIKIKYLAYNQLQEIVVPTGYTIVELNNYLRCVCNTFIITDMSPTSRAITI